MATDTVEYDVVKFFTRARRFPQMLGKTPDGKKLPGGPYTLTQFTGAGVAGLLLAGTRNLWGRFGLVPNLMILLTVMVVVVVGLGRIPLGSRSPVSMLLGLISALSAPRTGRISGRVLRMRNPHPVVSRVVINGPAAPETPPPPAEEPVLEPAGPVVLEPAAEPAASEQQPPALKESDGVQEEHASAPATNERNSRRRRRSTPTTPAAEPVAETAQPAMTGVGALLAMAGAPQHPTQEN